MSENSAHSTDLTSMKLTELKKLAQERGIKGISNLRKQNLIEKLTAVEPAAAPAEPKADAEAAAGEGRHFESRSAARRARRNKQRNNQRANQDAPTAEGAAATEAAAEAATERAEQASESGERGERRGGRNERGERRGGRNERGQRNRAQQNQNQQQAEPQEVPLQPIAGILDIIDSNIAFVRTTGYQAGSRDVFVPQNFIHKFGLRRGDQLVGAIRAPKEGESPAQQNTGRGRNNRGRNNKQLKGNALVRLDTVNGLDPEVAKKRPEFAKLTPLYPNQRLRLETDPNILTTRVIDLIMPIGKGQRALVVSPPKAGKTTLLKQVANAITTNNPECHLMVVLVDERPEEVTDMQRSVKGEVIASTFDRPPAEHTQVAELAIERAKRLVELGNDVVVLLDSITRLGRAYNNATPASGRILSGGVDSSALYPPKRFLGAARNIEEGGSLTIIATAMVETGSAGDTVIFEEFKGTGNAEIKLDRKISERRTFPAVDIAPSGTRKDDLLLGPDEAKVMHKLRRILSALEPQAAIDSLIKQLKKTKTNREFLAQVTTSAPMAAGENEEDYI
ncbi:MAG: transcription termination factor Rho [Corynebacterium sp.]|nr:transcription termination factor Rho [Corynebacterium sp.]